MLKFSPGFITLGLMSSDLLKCFVRSSWGTLLREVFFDATDFKEDVGGGVKPGLLEVFQGFYVKSVVSHKCIV